MKLTKSAKHINDVIIFNKEKSIEPICNPRDADWLFFVFSKIFKFFWEDTVFLPSEMAYQVKGFSERLKNLFGVP